MEFDQLMNSYTLPPELSQRLAASFRELKQLPQPVLYSSDSQETEKGAATLPLKDTQRLYTAIGEYSAGEVAKLFETDAGKELHRQITEVMTGAKDGLLLKGLPTDKETKALIIHGLKTLLGDGELSHPQPVLHRSKPEVILRAPRPKHVFHQDATPGRNNPDGSSFLFMASAQEEPYAAPTLFRKIANRGEGYVSHAFQPDEMILCNNKTLEHSSSKSGEVADPSARYLMRFTTDDTTLSHTMQHHEQVRDSIKVPHEGVALKNWVLAENERLKNKAEVQGRAL